MIEMDAQTTTDRAAVVATVSPFGLTTGGGEATDIATETAIADSR